MTARLQRGGVRVQGVSRKFKIVHDRNLTLKETLLRRKRVDATEIWAVRDVSFEVAPGEAVGIVGANGSGKSTLLKMIAGIFPPDEGTIETAGSVASMLELGAGFHPDFSGRENVFMNAAIHGLGEREVRDRLDEIVDFAEIAEFIDMPVRTYSSGMQMRLAFAVASHVDPDVLLLDEVLAVGDEAFQRKCMGRIFEYRRRGGTILFVSHDAATVERLCDRAVVLERGKVIADLPASEAMRAYHHRLADTAGNTVTPTEAPQNADEWGNHRVTIEDLHIVADGRPRRTVLSGQPVQIAFELVAREPVDLPLIGVGIKTPDGFMCFGTNTHLDGRNLGRIDGRHRVTFDLPALPLHEGSFVLHASIQAHDYTEVFHWLENQWAFTVVPERSGVGMVRMDPTWLIEPVAVSPAAGPR